jgi:hypothetical protein
LFAMSMSKQLWLHITSKYNLVMHVAEGFEKACFSSSYDYTGPLNLFIFKLWYTNMLGMSSLYLPRVLRHCASLYLFLIAYDICDLVRTLRDERWGMRDEGWGSMWSVKRHLPSSSCRLLSSTLWKGWW